MPEQSAAFARPKRATSAARAAPAEALTSGVPGLQGAPVAAPSEVPSEVRRPLGARKHAGVAAPTTGAKTDCTLVGGGSLLRLPIENKREPGVGAPARPGNVTLPGGGVQPISRARRSPSTIQQSRTG
jgi:hypothetical protein